MSIRRVVILMLPNPSKEEGAAARAVLGPDVSTQVVSTSGHTAGQTIPGDVILVGGGRKEIEQDTRGKFERYADMDAFIRAYRKEPQAQVSQPKARGQEQEPPPAPASHADAEWKYYDRRELIKYAAQRWPGARSWATLRDDAIRGAIREMESDSSRGDQP